MVSKKSVADESKKREFLLQLRECFGIVSTACRNSGVGKSSYYNWLQEDPEFASVAHEIISEQGDFVEGQLLKQIKYGNVTAIIFYCKTKLKDRGYTEKSVTPKVVSAPSVDVSAVEIKEKCFDYEGEYKRVKGEIEELLRGSNKYAPEMSLQIEVAARNLAFYRQLCFTARSEQLVNTEITREGNNKSVANPIVGMIQNQVAQVRQDLNALLMNYNKGEKSTPIDMESDPLLSLLRNGEE